MLYGIQDFVQSITSDNLPNDVSRHFDKVMALRYLIGGRSDVDIRVSEINGKFGFSVLIEKEEEAIRLSDKFNNTTLESYGKTLYVQSSLENENCISILLTKKKPE